MSFFRRILSPFVKRKHSSKFESVPTEDLIATAERLVLEAVRSYKPQSTDRGSRFSQAEFSPFIFFWIQHWHDQQPPSIRDYKTVLDVLIFKAQDGVPAIKGYHSINFHKGWDPDIWFQDRLRIYRNIILNEPQDRPNPSGPPSIFHAAHLLGTLAEKECKLEILPEVASTGDILDICLSRGYFGDALEQFNLYQTSTATMGTTLPLITEILTELHFRRLSRC